MPTIIECNKQLLDFRMPVDKITSCKRRQTQLQRDTPYPFSFLKNVQLCIQIQFVFAPSFRMRKFDKFPTIHYKVSSEPPSMAAQLKAQTGDNQIHEYTYADPEKNIFCS